MKRNKKKEDHVDESWLLPYADILTLLLALFIVLFAASELDAKKFQAIAESFNDELQGGTGNFEGLTPVEPEPETVEPPASEVEEPAEEPIDGATAEEIRVQRDFDELGSLQDRLNSYIEQQELGGVIETELTDLGLLLKIKDGALYSPGSATLSPESTVIAREISGLLVTKPLRDIFIEGHTDNVPSVSAEFPTNWELSAARAINFMKIVLENEELDPTLFSASGYGEHRPIASNDTVEGRAENRRVEVLISIRAEVEDESGL